MKLFLTLLLALVAIVCIIMLVAIYKTKRPTDAAIKSVTRLIFVTTQISALVWVFISYAIAIYASVKLEQVYTMAELSEPAIHTILGVSFLKVLENIFEHNDSVLFGKTKKGDVVDD